MTKKTIVLVSVLSQAAQLLLAAPAFSREGILMNEIRMEAREIAAARNNTIRGTLLCSVGSENTGQACSLKIRESGTDRVYEISANNSGRAELMRLFQAGTREVAIEGNLSGTTLEFAKAQKL